MLGAVLFDLDGVLIDSMPFHCRAWQKAFAILGLAVDPDDVYRLEGIEPRQVAASLHEKYTGLHPDPEILERVLKAKQHAYAEAFEVRPYPGVTDLLTRLQQCSVRMAVVTGASSIEEYPEMRRTILAYCNAVVAGGGQGGWKPEPGPYVSALTLLAVDATVSCVVENSPPGITSAIRAGLRCLAVRNNSPLGAEELLRAGADWVADDIEALTVKLFSMIGEHSAPRSHE